MLTISCLALTLVIAQATPGPDAEQFARIIAGLHSPIKDVELVCEGNIEFVDDTDPKKTEKMDRLNKRFQATYAYRSDGACYLDSYMRRTAPDSLIRRTEGVLKDKLTRLTQSSDQRPNPRPPVIDNGSAASIFHDGSPQRFILIWKWLPFIKNPRLWGYQLEGWEEVDNHRCLRITFDMFPGSNPPRTTLSRMWVDLERGGHVLKEEYARNGDVWYRIHNVKLEQFVMNNNEVVWFPVHGEFDSFANGGNFLKHPVLHESYDLVRGSVVFNQNLPDSRFAATWSGKKVDTPSIKEIERVFQDKQSRAKAKPSARTDPVGVEQDLNRRLADADAQSRRLKATPPSHVIWNSTTLAQASIAIISIGALVATIILKRRSG